MANEDPEYLLWIRQQGCLVCAKVPAEAHHAGRPGLGLRSHDHTAIPLCRQHHEEWHQLKGRFEMTKEQRAEWSVAAIAETRRKHHIWQQLEWF